MVIAGSLHNCFALTRQRLDKLDQAFQILCGMRHIEGLAYDFSCKALDSNGAFSLRHINTNCKHNYLSLKKIRNRARFLLIIC